MSLENARKAKELPRQKRSKEEVANCILTVRTGKARWIFEKPEIMPIKVYRIDPALLDEANLPESAIGDRVESAVEAAITSSPVFVEKTPKECKQSDMIADLLKGEREVANESGRVDVLLDNYVIEVKEASSANWKHGIGQVLVYSFYYPSRKPVLYLFGDGINEVRELAKKHCERLGVLYKDSSTSHTFLDGNLF